MTTVAVVTLRRRNDNKTRCPSIVVVAVVAMSILVATVRATAIAYDEPIATTFEGGETATMPADDSIYTIEEVAALNTTAAAAGDYEYDDYESSTDAVRNGRGRYLSKPAKYVLADAAVVKPAATIVVELAPATTITAMPTATITVPIATSTVPIATSTAPIATSTVPIATSTVPIATSTVPTATSTVPTATSTVPIATSIVLTATTTVPIATSTVPTATIAVPLTITQSGVLVQVASPPGYDATMMTDTIIATTPMPSRSSTNSFYSLFTILAPTIITMSVLNV